MLGALAAAFVCVLIILRGRLRRYRMLACYFGGSVLVDAVKGTFLLHYGTHWIQYSNIFYFTDCLLTMLLYFAVVAVSMPGHSDRKKSMTSCCC
jgi:hypothetical protein